MVEMETDLPVFEGDVNRGACLDAFLEVRVMVVSKIIDFFLFLEHPWLLPLRLVFPVTEHR